MELFPALSDSLPQSLRNTGRMKEGRLMLASQYFKPTLVLQTTYTVSKSLISFLVYPVWVLCLDQK